jgi:hypothetical protein
VIFDAQHDAGIASSRDTPDIDRVHDVTEMQVPCRRWSESRQR